VAHVRPRHQHHPQPDQEKDDGRAQVRLAEDQRGGEDSDGQRRQENAQLFDVLMVVREILREEQDDDKLADLRGLDLRAADLDPATRAVDRGPNRQDEHQAGEETQVHPQRALRQEPVVHAGQHKADAKPGGGEDHLPADDIGQRPLATASARQAAAVEKHQPEGHKAKARRQQQEVELAGLAGDHGALP
jgi:hypothetical protein